MNKVPWIQLFEAIGSAKQALNLSQYWEVRPYFANGYIVLGKNNDVVLELEIEDGEVGYFVVAHELGKKFHTNNLKSAVLEAFVWIAEIEVSSVLRGV